MPGQPCTYLTRHPHTAAHLLQLSTRTPLCWHLSQTALELRSAMT